MTREKRDVEKRAIAGTLTLSNPSYASEFFRFLRLLAHAFGGLTLCTSHVEWFGAVSVGTPVSRSRPRLPGAVLPLC